MDALPRNVDSGVGLPHPQGQRRHAKGEKDESAHDEDEKPERDQIIIEENDRHRDDHEVVAGGVQVPARRT